MRLLKRFSKVAGNTLAGVTAGVALLTTLSFNPLSAQTASNTPKETSNNTLTVVTPQANAEVTAPDAAVLDTTGYAHNLNVYGDESVALVATLVDADMATLFKDSLDSTVPLVDIVGYPRMADLIERFVGNNDPGVDFSQLTASEFLAAYVIAPANVAMNPPPQQPVPGGEKPTADDNSAYNAFNYIVQDEDGNQIQDAEVYVPAGAVNPSLVIDPETGVITGLTNDGNQPGTSVLTFTDARVVGQWDANDTAGDTVPESPWSGYIGVGHRTTGGHAYFSAAAQDQVQTTERGGFGTLGLRYTFAGRKGVPTTIYGEAETGWNTTTTSGNYGRGINYPNNETGYLNFRGTIGVERNNLFVEGGANHRLMYYASFTGAEQAVIGHNEWFVRGGFIGCLGNIGDGNSLDVKGFAEAIFQMGGDLLNGQSYGDPGDWQRVHVDGAGVAFIFNRSRALEVEAGASYLMTRDVPNADRGRGNFFVTMTHNF